MHLDFTIELTRTDRGDWYGTAFINGPLGLDDIHRTTGNSAYDVLGRLEIAINNHTHDVDAAEELDERTWSCHIEDQGAAS